MSRWKLMMMTTPVITAISAMIYVKDNNFKLKLPWYGFGTRKRRSVKYMCIQLRNLSA